MRKKFGVRMMAVMVAAAMVLSATGCQEITDSDMLRSLQGKENGDGSQVTGQLAEEENAAFEAFLEKEYLHFVEVDCLERNLGVSDYAAYGITDPDNTLIARNEDFLAWAVEEDQRSLQTLETFDVNLLNEQNRVSYENYHFYLTHDLILSQYPLFHEQYNPYTGDFTNIVMAMMEYKFRQKRDFEDYLEILSSLPDCMEDMLAMTKRQAAEGYFMTDDALDKQVKDMREVVTKGEDWALVAFFDNNVDGFIGLSEEEASAYKQSCREIVLGQILPAYEEVADALEALRGSRRLDGSITRYEGGERYYTALAALKTASTHSVDELIEEAVEAYESCLEYMAWIWQNTEIEDVEETELSDIEEMMEFAEEHMDCFPDKIEMPYSIFYLNPDFANDSIAAYYLIPPMDDLTENMIKVNPDILDSYLTNELFFTISHEGIPGHMYQMLYASDHGMPAITPCLGLLGYEEGWAQYAAARMIMELPIDEDSRKLTMVENVWEYLFMSLLDLWINGKGMTYEEVLKEVEELGLPRECLEPENYRYFIDTFGMSLPYGLGEIAFLSERDKVQKALGDDFDEVEFHEILLLRGTRLFDSVEEDVNAYLQEKKARIPKSYGVFDTEIRQEMHSR